MTVRRNRVIGPSGDRVKEERQCLIDINRLHEELSVRSVRSVQSVFWPLTLSHNTFLRNEVRICCPLGRPQRKQISRANIRRFGMTVSEGSHRRKFYFTR